MKLLKIVLNDRSAVVSRVNVKRIGKVNSKRPPLLKLKFKTPELTPQIVSTLYKKRLKPLIKKN